MNFVGQARLSLTQRKQKLKLKQSEHIKKRTKLKGAVLVEQSLLSLQRQLVDVATSSSAVPALP